MESQAKKVNGFLENMDLFQNLFSLKSENKVDKTKELERRLYLFHQCVVLLREENLKLKKELMMIPPPEPSLSKVITHAK